MRLCSSVKPEIFTNGKKNSKQAVLGVAFGYDYAAEHECGIGGIRNAFGSCVPNRYHQGPTMSPYEHWVHLNSNKDSSLLGVGSLLPDIKLPPLGVERRKVNSVPEGLKWHETPNWSGFAYGDYHYVNGTGTVAGVSPSRLEDTACRLTNDDLVAAWDQSSFFVMGRNPKVIKDLKTIFDALMNKDAVFTIGQTEGVGGSGFSIMIASQLPGKVVTSWSSGDLDSFERDREFADTGVEKLLRSKGKNWFYLGRYGDSPALASEKMAWLNPQQQDIYNAGWFTVAELRQWADNKGPVMKSRG